MGESGWFTKKPLDCRRFDGERYKGRKKIKKRLQRFNEFDNLKEGIEF